MPLTTFDILSEAREETLTFEKDPAWPLKEVEVDSRYPMPPLIEKILEQIPQAAWPYLPSRLLIARDEVQRGAVSWDKIVSLRMSLGHALEARSLVSTSMLWGSSGNRF